MAHFCTKCGTPSDNAALFCDNCGASLQVNAGATVGAPAPLIAPRRKTSRRMLGLVGACVAIVAVGAAVLAYALAPEAASSASFSRAVNDYLAKDQAASDRLVCAANLPYQTNPIRVAEYDRSTRQWMELLSQAGVYAVPTTETGGGFMQQTQYLYQMTDVGRASVRNNKLCIAGGARATASTGFEQVQKTGVQAAAMAKATLELQHEAAWLAKSPQRAQILQHLGMASLGVQLPLALVDKKWQVDTDPQHAYAMRQQRGFGMQGGMPGAGAPPASAPRLLERVRAMFSFGHPLVGKWSDSTGMAHFEFTRDSIVANGGVTAATFKVNGKEVVVTPANAGAGMVFKMRDADHAVLDMGVMTIVLVRSP
jgi:hypothetical protein